MEKKRLSSPRVAQLLFGNTEQKKKKNAGFTPTLWLTTCQTQNTIITTAHKEEPLLIKMTNSDSCLMLDQWILIIVETKILWMQPL